MEISAVKDPAEVARLLRQYSEATRPWELTVKEHAALLDVPIATFSRIRDGSFRGRLGQDKVTRIRYVVGIRRLLDKFYIPSSWLFTNNPALGFKFVAPIDKILSGGIVAMHEVFAALLKTGQRS